MAAAACLHFLGAVYTLRTFTSVTGLEYWVQLLFNFTPMSVRQV